MDENKKKALSAALSQIEKQFGKGSVMRMGDGGPTANIEAISTGSIGWMLRWVLAACRRGVWLKSTALNHPVRPR